MKKRIIYLFLACAYAACGWNCTGGSCQDRPSDTITVACYYFPGYHTRDSSELRYSLQHSNDWSEWELVKEAKPRFEGHRQPYVPVWGYEDEKDPAVMAKKIRAAATHGVDAFIFDWYWYEGGPFLNRCLDEGFLGAPNTDSLKFALMWACHDWSDRFPATAGRKKTPMYSASVDSAGFETMGDVLVRDYFTRPNYWKIDGKPFFSIYNVPAFVQGLGSLAAARRAMERLDAKAMRAGLEGVHWNLLAFGTSVLPGEQVATDQAELQRRLGANSSTSYVWVTHTTLPDRETDYNLVRDQYMAHWDTVRTQYDAPYFPNITVGWDASPRTNQSEPWVGGGGADYPYMNIVVNNTPENFKKVLEMTKERLLADPNGPRALTINCWNEWTEGSCLEPDTLYGMAYLDALKEVFGR